MGLLSKQCAFCRKKWLWFLVTQRTINIPRIGASKSELAMCPRCYKIAKKLNNKDGKANQKTGGIR